MEIPPLISSEFRKCHDGFKNLCSEPSLKDAIVPLRLWSNQLGRFRIWASNVAAHQTTQASLDHRLRDASHIRLQVVSLLRSIDRQITEVHDILQEGEEVKGLEAAHDGSTEHGGADESAIEIQECFDTLVNAIDCLYQASMIIRAPARHDRLVDTEQSATDVFKAWDEIHVSDKFPGAKESIRIRLASAITQRRRDLDHRKRHQDKLRRGLPKIGDDEKSSVAPSETIATELRKVNLSLDDAASVAGFSETSLAESLVQGPRVPAIPEGWTPNQGFECPYCNLPNVVIKDRAAWTKHVLKDMYPYLCLYPNCSTPNLMYDSRHAWFNHMLQSHIDSPDEPISGVLVQNLPSKIPCPLCLEEIPGRISEKHMARHLQELTFWALPTENLENTIDESDESFRDSTADLPVDQQSSEDSDPSQRAWPLAEPQETMATPEDQVRGVGAAESTLKGIPKKPTQGLDEESDRAIGGVRFILDDKKDPPEARWTQLLRTIVDPAALKAFGERFEEHEDSVVVPRLLTMEEVKKFMRWTTDMRGQQIEALQANAQQALAQQERRFDESGQEPSDQEHMSLDRIEARDEDDGVVESSSQKTSRDESISPGDATYSRDSEPPLGQTGIRGQYIPAEGIEREVIQHDSQRYLGNDALVRPTRFQGLSGYIIDAHRNLTSRMIDDLERDSARLVAENRANRAAGYPPVSYNQSDTFADIHEQSTEPRDPTTPRSQAARGNEYFISADGIEREVIQNDICRYLGRDALVRPTTYQGRQGYIFTAYRNLTSQMVDDLKSDSARWVAENRANRAAGYRPVSYDQSDTYLGRRP